MYAGLGDLISQNINQYANYRMDEPARQEAAEMRRLQREGLERDATREQQMSRRDAAITALFEMYPEGPPEPELMRVGGPQLVKQVRELEVKLDPQDEAARLGLLRDLSRGIMALPDEKKQAAYGELASYAKGRGWADVPEAFDPAVIQRFAAYGQASAQPQDLMNIGGGRVFDPNTRGLAYEAPAEAPATVDAALLAAQQRGNQPEVQRLLALKQQIARAGQAPSVAQQEYVTLVGPKGEQRDVTPGREANALMAQGWRKYDAVVARQGPGGANPLSAAYSAERRARTTQSIDELLGTRGPDGRREEGGLLNNFTTGYGAKLTGWLPASDARRVAGKLTTLKASIAQQELNEMRAASRTGGALGQVAVQELVMLENSLGALDQQLDDADLAVELEKVQGSIDRWENAKEAIGKANTGEGFDQSSPAPRVYYDESGKQIRR